MIFFVVIGIILYILKRDKKYIFVTAGLIASIIYALFWPNAYSYYAQSVAMLCYLIFLYLKIYYQLVIFPEYLI